jgi:hypothetical protein
MNRRTRCSIWITALVAALVLGFMVPSPQAVQAQESALKDMVYVSPTWGYSVRWYSSEWTIADESSDEKTDVLALQDTLGNFISFSGSPQFEGDASACLDDMVDQVLAIPGAADPETVEGDFGMPFDWREPEQAYILMQVRLPVAGVLQDHAVYLECQTLVPGEAVFQRYYSGPVAVLDQWYDDIVETLEGVFLPASAWLPNPDQEQQIWAGIAPLSGAWRTNAVILPNDQGDPQLLVGLANAAGDIRVVRFENISDEVVTVKPENLVLEVSSMREDGARPSQQPYSVTWDDGGKANEDGFRDLKPGEHATVQVAIAPVDESTIACDTAPLLVFQYVQPESDQVALIASSAMTTCFQAESSAESSTVGAPAAAGRPKLRLSR